MSHFRYRWQSERRKYSCRYHRGNRDYPLPYPLDPEHVKQLVSAIDEVRDRAMILMLLRTGMRIGELLNVQYQDLNTKEQKVIIRRSAKNGPGRVAYFSEDARSALKSWLRKRDSETDTLFHSRNRGQLSYASARAMFNKYLAKAGLLDKGYTLHCLRHTYASELLNAGMRLESLQKLMGHRDIEVTRRYARLTDKTLEKEYFRAMSIIEGGEIDGQYRFNL